MRVKFSRICLQKNLPLFLFITDSTVSVRFSKTGSQQPQQRLQCLKITIFYRILSFKEPLWCYHCTNVSLFTYFRKFVSIVIFLILCFFSPTPVEVVILELKIEKKKKCRSSGKKNMAAQSARNTYSTTLVVA